MIIEVVGKEIEKIKGDFESYLNGLNMVGEISYSQYSELYDEGTKQIQRAYELGKSELEKENAELRHQLNKNPCVCNTEWHCNDCLEQLTKAKEIIREFMNWYWETDICSDSMPPELRQKTEQFLSEVEK